MRISQLVLLFPLTSCTVYHSHYKTPSGATHYTITCGNEFERCEARARKLCPNGFERFGSFKRSKLDTPRLLVKTEREFELEIECD
jgi:hypothetical protein